MKKFFVKTLIAGCLAVSCLALLPSAQAAITTPPQAYPAYSGTSTNAGTLSYAVIGCNNVYGEQGTPVVTFIHAQSDKAASALTFYRVVALVAAQTNSTTRIDVNTTNGIPAPQSGTIVIRHVSNDWYEKRTLTSNTGATNLVVTAAPVQAVASGDIIYKVVAANTISWGASTNSVIGNCIAAGQPGCPLLVDLDATTTGNINSISATFVK